MNRSLATDVNHNWRIWLTTLADRVPGGDSRQFGSAIAASTGVDIMTMNRVIVQEGTSGADIEAALTWIRRQDVPFMVTAAGPSVEAVEAVEGTLGISRHGVASPGMALDSLTAIPEPDSPVAISAVTSPSERSDFAAVFANAVGVPAEEAISLVPTSLLELPNVTLFLGRIDGAAVACGQLVQTDSVAGVYFIDVLEDFRRRGIGTAMTQAVLRAGVESGCQVGVLVSTIVGQPLYESMGFETVTEHHHWLDDG